MKTEFLKDLGLSEEAIAKIFAESGKDVEREKAKMAISIHAPLGGVRLIRDYADRLVDYISIHAPLGGVRPCRRARRGKGE